MSKRKHPIVITLERSAVQVAKIQVNVAGISGVAAACQAAARALNGPNGFALGDDLPGGMRVVMLEMSPDTESSWETMDVAEVAP